VLMKSTKKKLSVARREGKGEIFLFRNNED
jgi:hypothetical protein